MADELKTLLQIEGDATGVKRAAGEAVQAAQGVAQQTTATGSATKDAGEESVKAAKKSKTAFEENRQSLNALRELVSRFSPELGQLGEVAMKSGELGSQGFGLIAGAVGVLALSINSIIESLRTMQEQTKASAEAWDRMADSASRARAVTSQRVETSADALAKAGIVSEPANAAAANIVRTLGQQGYKEDAVRKVLPFAVNEAGEVTMTEDEIKRLATQEEFDPGKLDFKSPKEMARVLRSARRNAERNSGLLANQQRGVESRRTRQDSAVAQGDHAALIARLKEQEPGMTDEEASAALNDVYAIEQRGFVEVPDSGIPLKSEFDNLSRETRLKWTNRQQQAVRRARALGRINENQMNRMSGVSFSQAFDTQRSHGLADYGVEAVPKNLGSEGSGGGIISDFLDGLNSDFKKWDDDVNRLVGNAVKGGRNLDEMREDARKIIIHHYHGPVFQNRNPDRFAEHRRVEP